MIQKIGVGLVFLLVCYGLLTLGTFTASTEFKTKLDSLDKVNDSLLVENVKDDSTITELRVLDEQLETKVYTQKVEIEKIKKQVGATKVIVQAYTKGELTDWYNKRYPTDTVTDLMPVAKPVLVSAATDLVAYDGAVKEVVVKDSIISLQENRLTLKDSTINLFVNKEGRYKAIISNKDQAIVEWNKQYDILNLNYKKLKVKNKFQKIGSYIIIGGLAYTLLAK